MIVRGSAHPIYIYICKSTTQYFIDIDDLVSHVKYFHQGIVVNIVFSWLIVYGLLTSYLFLCLVDVMKPGTTVNVWNAKIDMFKGTMRLCSRQVGSYRGHWTCYIHGERRQPYVLGWVRACQCHKIVIFKLVDRYFPV